MVNAAAIVGLKADLAREAQRLGFAACGITAAAEDPLRARRLEEWLGAGRHGEMEWMAARAHHRRSPQGLWPEAERVIALGMSYAPAVDPLATHAGRARISVYAQGSDYHDTVKKALKALARWIAASSAPRPVPADSPEPVVIDALPSLDRDLPDHSVRDDPPTLSRLKGSLMHSCISRGTRRSGSTRHGQASRRR